MNPPEPTPVGTELAAMRRLVAVLDALDDATRCRVLRWLASRYTPAMTTEES